MHSRMIATYTCACLTPPKVHALCIIMRVHKRVRLYEHGLRSRATAYIRTDELRVEILILFLLQLLPLHVPQDQKMGMSAMIPVQPWSLLICAHTLMLGLGFIHGYIVDLSTVLSQYELNFFQLHKLIMCMYGEVHVRNVHVCIYMYMISTCKCILIKMMCEVIEPSA